MVNAPTCILIQRLCKQCTVSHLHRTMVCWLPFQVKVVGSLQAGMQVQTWQALLPLRPIQLSSWTRPHRTVHHSHHTVQTRCLHTAPQHMPLQRLLLWCLRVGAALPTSTALSTCSSCRQPPLVHQLAGGDVEQLLQHTAVLISLPAQLHWRANVALPLCTAECEALWGGGSPHDVCMHPADYAGAGDCS